MARLALSLSGGLEKIGAYAGLAAVVGLGVLSLLYFSQAREVRRLREWAGGAPERARRPGGGGRGPPGGGPPAPGSGGPSPRAPPPRRPRPRVGPRPRRPRPPPRS